MAWTIKYEAPARKQLRKLDKANGKRVLVGLEKIAALDNPRQRGAALRGNRAGYWRWRFGDYRVIGRIADDVLVIMIVAVGHRRQVYD